MKILKRWIIRELSRKAGPYLKSYGLLRTVKYKSALVWDPKGKRVLVLAPHMDDEVIGCGGALVKHIRNGAEAKVVFMTDGRFGSKSIQELSPEELKKRQTRLVQTRKEEARLALKTLGVQESVFLDAEDGQLSSTAAIRERLAKILNSMQPDVVYLPFFLEGHPDHKATSQILVDATRDSKLEFDCFGYEVWTPLFPNCLVDIDDVVEVKKEALNHYKSQLTDVDYLHSSLGLNAYRSSALLDCQSRYVEAFFQAPLKDYRKLHQRFCECEN
jgi:N-acetylglucosamine malate deacetylase 1